MSLPCVLVEAGGKRSLIKFLAVTVCTVHLCSILETGLRSLRSESDGADEKASTGTGAREGNRRLRRDGHAGSARHRPGTAVYVVSYVSYFAVAAAACLVIPMMRPNALALEMSSASLARFPAAS